MDVTIDKCNKKSGTKVLFLGSKKFGLNIFEHVLKVAYDAVCAFITMDDTDDVRSALPEIKAFCALNKKPVEIISKSEQLEKCISVYQPDLCFVVCWYAMLSENILNSVPQGFIGIHNSKLPAYRGQAPLVWQMINGEKETGYSIFSFTPGMDDGDIWHQEGVLIDEDDYIDNVMKKIEERAAGFIDRHFVDLLNGTIVPVPQRADGVSYAGKRTAEDGRINWREDHDKIYDFIRAQSRPYPGAFTVYDNEKVIIWKAEKFKYPIYGTPGQIGLIDKTEGTIVVVCGNSRGLTISELEVNGEIKKAARYIKSLKHKFISA